MPRPEAYFPIDPEIEALAGAHGRQPEALLDLFRALQARHGGLTRRAILDAARALGVPAAQAFGVATFYSLLDTPPGTRPVARVCDGPACWLHGSAEARAGLEAELGQTWQVERSSCLGLCDRAPAGLIEDLDGTVRQAGPLLAPQVLVERRQWQGVPAAGARPRPGETRVMLARAGLIDPDSLESARAQGAYRALETALGRPPESVLAEIEASGLTGRGGAGYPTGRKWRLAAGQAGPAEPAKTIVCNADESEPLAFKDRTLIDLDPHQLLEGIILAGYAVGAAEGLIYLRGEYLSQAERLERALRQANESGWLGDRIRGSGFSFRIRLHMGAGAYICGEETALLESLEGRRGEPRLRPPFPTQSGYHGAPTVVNNVETLCAVPAIIRGGADWYRSIARRAEGATPGTKLYTLLGHVAQPGLFEAPFGLTLREAIEGFGGGMRSGANFHFALVGGAAGTIVPAALLDAPLDFEPGRPVPLGTGAFLVCDQTVSPAALLREAMHFFEAETCGKCPPCRLGTRQARVMLDRLAAGQGRPGDTAGLAALAEVLREASFCGLGVSAAGAIESALKFFPEAFAASKSDEVRP